MLLVFASGSRPDACAYGHPWTGNGTMALSWFTCTCPGASTNPAGYGHHRIRCLSPGCPSVWHDPEHTEPEPVASS